MNELNIEEIKWNNDNLLPVIVQDYLTGKVLMLAYMNKESLTKTIQTKETWFFSRSRQSLWHKGETSGNIQKVVSWGLDCDRDTLLLQVKPTGPSCHLGRESCFEEGSETLIEELSKVIRKRAEERPAGSYTTYLFTEGLDKILKKVGEEAAEVIIAAKNKNPEEIASEMADLIYHLLVLLTEREMHLRQVLQVLVKRRS
ncbi:MAG: bifunctional phosphoribosyl-AMP cyclohydrolase/phosphoribosyl-ATP diphosphatase HisIE [Clostridia bacterium]|nr:bifunctional phosphoribosyl-AMP cyclohydrolase/phosphoribosyl-ATP diphosphatase HisIE [Clostridia bacterium]